MFFPHTPGIGGREMTHEPGKHNHSGEDRSAGDESIDRIWLAAMWPFFRDHLPPPPATVVEIGCGPYGGHVPALLHDGYDAVGVDPQAPDGPAYRREPFEDYTPTGPVDAVIASVSLHHVQDVGRALDHVAGMLRPGGRVVIVEWFSEEFDESTARWCFRNQNRNAGESDDWMSRLHAEWIDSALPWDAYFGERLASHGLHPASTIRRELIARFKTVHESKGPYYFPSLFGADSHAEQAAIDSGEIRAGSFRYQGQLGQ